MKFAGWQRVSLVDYPGKISSVLFTSGCNMDCIYCHNSDLKKRINETITEDLIIKYIKEKRKVLDALVITGGEPSLHKKELIKFIKKIKEKFPDFLIKVDTNGSSEEFISEIIPLVDFIAADFKGLDYKLFSNFDTELILKNLSLLKSAKEYEIRITLYPGYINENDFIMIAEKLKDHKKVVIQQYRKNKDSDLEPYKREILSKFFCILKDYVKYVDIRE